MKHYYPKWRSVELAQQADRRGPGIAPELNYCLPGSRFAKMMQLARMGASNRMFRRHIPGIDGITIEVARKLAEEMAHGAPEQTPAGEEEPVVLAG